MLAEIAAALSFLGPTSPGAQFTCFTSTKVQILTEVAAALSFLGPSSPDALVVWSLVTKALLRLSAMDLDAKSTISLLNALARSRELYSVPDALSTAKIRQHLLEAIKNGVYGRLPGSAGSNGWPIEDKGVVVMLTNALSRNGSSELAFIALLVLKYLALGTKISNEQQHLLEQDA